MSDEQRVLLQVRIPKALIKRVDHLAIDHELTRTKMVEVILTRWIEQHRADDKERP